MLRFIIATAIIATAAAVCTDPKVQASSYTPADSQVLAAIPYIAEFSLTCGNGETPSLYADIDGALVPVAQSLDGSKYQVSWIKEIKKAKTGDNSVALYDVEGYSALRRSRERGEAATVAPLVTIIVNYPGSFAGPWFNSQHFALALSALVFYLAVSSKSALLA
ncbi:translocon-associated protein subunit delta [Eurytemora carolleeae]|uniref:translocon-associated protein subunit delta n=1 Tax=Eurytemora carolleeae TaxID=1294199 RepID=UPI000C76D8B9|nr:translocon-associated protein subunit delta [Eurytemora carolleeae]|eukprot:XP_023331356.1 translocon-associated protein subunit delta-like [Eurytemora affinis]